MSTSTDTFLSVVGTYKIHSEDAAAFTKNAVESVARTVKEPGCLYYTISEDVTEPGRFHLSEGWASKEALDVHAADPEFQASVEQARKLRILSRQIHVSESKGRTLVISEGEGSNSASG